MAKAREREARIDRLYELPLGEFTAARDELAASLRHQGDKDAAAEVKRLRKPSVAAWALNQVQRSDPQRVDQLLEAGGRLREAQESLLEGGGREALDEASEDERRLVAELARHAERELVAAGRPVSASVQEKLRATLHAVATDAEARGRLGSGRLVREHTPSGLGTLMEAKQRPPARERRRRAPKGDDDALARKARRLEEHLERARDTQEEREQEHSEARRDLREARREAARAASSLERAEAAEEQARGRADEAADRAEQAEAALRELQARRG
jgi:hypothetical protein